MSSLIILALSKVLDNLIPLLVTGLSSWIAVRYNGLLKAKEEQLKAVGVSSSAFDKLNLTDATLDFVNKKAEEGLHVAAEKALQSWKDSGVKELTGVEKKSIAVDYVLSAVSGVVTEKSVIDNIPNIVEKVLSNNRSKIDDVYENLKKKFVLFTGSVPANSTNPFGSPDPSHGNVVPTLK